MDIKEIAGQVSKRIYVEDGLLLSKFISEKFAEALIESYKAELLNVVASTPPRTRTAICPCCFLTSRKHENTVEMTTQSSLLLSQESEMNINLPELAEGETYVGCIGDALGNLHHVILLPGDNDDATHEAQLEWAKSIGGDLPSRIEQAMLWANHREQFKKGWYWSNEIHHSESGWAWSQNFFHGLQYDYHKTRERRARAVRRLPI